MASTSGRDSAFAVIRRGSRVLLVRTRSGRWQLPGGRLLAGEKHWDAALREVEEETGLRITILGLTGIYARRSRSRAVIFAARVPRGTKTAGPRNEISEQRWVSPHRAAEVLGKKARRRLRDALAAPKVNAAKSGRPSKWRAAIG